MKDICEGRRTRNDVVHESIGMYREVFMKANREVNVLVEVAVLYLKLISGVPAASARRKLNDTERTWITSSRKKIVTRQSQFLDS